MDKHITVPMKKETVATLKAGDYVYLTGTVYTARDAAHKRMYEILQEGGELPIDIQGQVIYYMGPSPAREGRPIGSAGPTTASRMDKYAPQLLDLGLGAMIGKGKRNQAVIDAIVRNGSVYFAAVGGAGALLSKCITSSEVVAYDDLGIKMGIIFMKQQLRIIAEWRRMHEKNSTDGIAESADRAGRMD